MPPNKPTEKSQGPYDDLLCFNFYRGWRAIQAYYSDCFEAGMNSQRIYALGMCTGKGNTISTIASALDIEPPAVSALLDRMERDGLVQRVRSTKNRREVIAKATTLGNKMAKRTEARLRDADTLLFQNLSVDDVEHVRRIVTEISKRSRNE